MSDFFNTAASPPTSSLSYVDEVRDENGTTLRITLTDAAEVEAWYAWLLERMCRNALLTKMLEQPPRSPQTPREITVLKTLDDNFRDWESYAFGFGYGTGEIHIIPAIKQFLTACPDDGVYDYTILEKAVGPTAAWLFVNVLAQHRVGMIGYGTSPRFGWLNENGKALRAFVLDKTDDYLIGLATNCNEDYAHCYPDACNCGPKGYEVGKVCINPFWPQRS